MPKIEFIYAYISHEKDDPEDEGVTAFMLLDKWRPMVGADEERMASLKPTAQEIANISGQKITLAKFSVRTDLETIEPEAVQIEEPHSQRIQYSLRAEEQACWNREDDRSEILLEWAREQGLSEDPERIPKLYAEARRRWCHLTTRLGIGKILEATLEKL